MTCGRRLHEVDLAPSKVWVKQGLTGSHVALWTKEPSAFSLASHEAAGKCPSGNWRLSACKIDDLFDHDWKEFPYQDRRESQRRTIRMRVPYPSHISETSCSASSIDFNASIEARLRQQMLLESITLCMYLVQILVVKGLSTLYQQWRCLVQYNQD